MNDSSEHVYNSPDGGWRPPLEDGDENGGEGGVHDQFQYMGGGLVGVSAVGDGAGTGTGTGDGGLGSASEHGGSGAGTPSMHSRVSAPASSSYHGGQLSTPYIIGAGAGSGFGFGQAGESMKVNENNPMMNMSAITAPRPVSYRRRTISGSPSLDPASWFGGKDAGYGDPNFQSGPSSHGHSSAAHATGIGPGSRNASDEDDVSASHPHHHQQHQYHYFPARSTSTSHLIASSSSEVGSSSGHRRSAEAKRQQNPVPPTSYSFRKRDGSDKKKNNGTSTSHSSLKDIIGRLRGSRTSSPSPTDRPIDTQATSPPPSPVAIRFPEPALLAPSPSASATPYNPIVQVRSPTPPSSLLRPQSPSTVNHPNLPQNRPTIIGIAASAPTTPEDIGSGDRLWPPLTLPTFPSPAVSDDSHDISPEGLLDPRLPWRLEQSRGDSMTSLRDHEDYSRPIGRLFVQNGEHSSTTLDTHDVIDA